MKKILTLGLLLLSLYSNAQYNFNEIEIWPGNQAGNPRYFTEMNGYLYFQGQNNYNNELWKSNGTPSGTSIVVDLDGTASSSPQSLKAFNGEMFFTAFVTGSGRELWKSDGTAAGTVFLKDIRPGTSSGFESTSSVFNGDRETFMEFAGELFFFGNTGNGVDLWKTDGTVNGTVSVKNFTQLPIYGVGKYTTNRERDKVGVIYNNELYFLVSKSSPVPMEYRGELWKTDGTTAGTTLVKDSLDVSVNSLVVANSKIYFVNETATNGEELWSSDGTSFGTVLESDIDPGSAHSEPEYLTPYNGALYFSAHGDFGSELYKTDGISTTLVKDIYPGMGTTTANSSITLARFYEYNGLLYFLAKDATSGGLNELWKTDGTDLGTVKALTLGQMGGFIEFLHPQTYDNKIFYRTSSQLWVTDGTPSNIQQLTDNGNTSEPISQVKHLALFQQNLWFAGANISNGVEAWYIGNQPPTSVDASTCSSYTVPSGDETYTVSGIYTDTVLNTQGSDSILIINLTINQASTSTINVETCDNYTSPSGNYTWSVPGVYMDTLTNLYGCDSVITINMSVLTSSSTINVETCDTYTSPSGNYTWSVPGIYLDTLTNSFGCDSVITINMSVLTSSSTINESACNSYVSPSGNYTWTTSGLYSDTLTNAAGCDSVVTINLSMLNSSNTISEITCDSYTSPSGNYVWNNSGTYADTIVNAAGCDSVITINLTVQQVDVSVQNNMGTLEANSSTSTYQWLDCSNNFAIIPGETNQNFTPLLTGNYSVEVTEGSCKDTSDCFQVEVSGIHQIEQNYISIFPNPSNGIVSVKSEFFTNSDRLIITNGLGQKVYEGTVDEVITNIELPKEAGLYVLNYIDEHRNVYFRIVRL